MPAFLRRHRFLLPLSLLSCAASALAATGKISVANYPTIQAAIDANPGKMIFVPPGDYRVNTTIRIEKDNTGLYGYGRLIQTDPTKTLIAINNANGVQLRDLTLQGTKMKIAQPAVLADNVRDLTLDNLQVRDNCSPDRGSIALNQVHNAIVRNCLVENYKAISVDDRTANKHYGYAFNCTDGTGLRAEHGEAILFENNRILENELIPNPEVAAKYNLGKFIKKNPVKGDLVSQEWWDSGTVKNWPQGAAVQVTSPEDTGYVQMLGNYAENAEQGFDVHADHVILAQNITVNTCLGTKFLHGARNALITSNQFSKCDINGVLLQPGAASHAIAKPVHGENPATSPANIDGASIVSYNIISDFGTGSSHWIWGPERWAMEFNSSQTDIAPPLRDMLVRGNIVYDGGKDGILVDGKPAIRPPEYKYAVYVSQEKLGPQNVVLQDNILDPGSAGASNVPAN